MGDAAFGARWRDVEKKQDSTLLLDNKVLLENSQWLDARDWMRGAVDVGVWCATSSSRPSARTDVLGRAGLLVGGFGCEI